MRQSLVYTLHFWPKLEHAGHYTGSSHKLPARLVDHVLGRAPGSPRSSVSAAARGWSAAWSRAGTTGNANSRTSPRRQHGITRDTIT
jgi:hypothetical protein